MDRVALIDSFNEIAEVKVLDESVINEKKEFKSKVDGTHIIGMIEGIFFGPDKMSRNGRWYPKEVWTEQFKATSFKKKLRNQTMFGEIGHSTGQVTDMTLRSGTVSHFMDEAWIDETGNGMGRAYILNTPAGQLLKTYLGAGCKLKVSSRGVGSFVQNEMKEGHPVVDPKTFEAFGWDFVLEPGFLETNPQLKEDYEKITQIDKLITIEENTTKGENNMGIDVDSYVAELKEEKKQAIDEAKTLNEQLKGKDIEMSKKEVEFQNLTEELQSFQDLGKTVEEIQESFTALEEAKTEITGLTEKLSTYEEKAGTFEELEEATNLSTKAVLTLAKYQELGTIKELKEIKENSEKAVTKLNESEKLETLAERAHKMLTEYAELGTVQELKDIKEAATKIVTTQNTKTKLAEAKELSGEFKCSVESAGKLIDKLGLEEAKNTLSTLLKDREPTKELPEDVKNLVEADADGAPKVAEPKEVKPKVDLKVQGLLQTIKAEPFNKEALGKETSTDLLAIKPLNPTVGKLSNEYGSPKIETPKKVVDEEPKDITPEEANKAVKTALTK